MQNLDLTYICSIIGNLSGIPIRLFQNQKLTFYHSQVNLPKDPMTLYKTEIFSIPNKLGYFITPFFNYYGIVKTSDYQIVIGPTRQVPAIEKDLRELAFQLDLIQENADTFVNAMKSIVSMPLESVLQILCVINYILNDEKLKLEDIAIYDAVQYDLIKKIQQDQAEKRFTQQPQSQEIHNTLALEQTLMDIVRKGDTSTLKDWLSNAPAVKGGLLANTQLRQQKNMFIVTATLVSRNAIRGGMDIEEALSLSDSYIQKCELMTFIVGITNLQYRMILDFTERVEKIRLGKTPSKLALDVSNYVRHHISEPITTQQLAKHLFLSRSRLSTKFKAETGLTLNSFITKEKIEEAKCLLRYSDKPILSISYFLGFSSQSHFSQVFKKHTGKTPIEYRDLHTT